MDETGGNSVELDRMDWEEARCIWEKPDWVKEEKRERGRAGGHTHGHAHSHGRGIPVEEVIGGLDRLFEKNRYQEAGVYLEEWLKKAGELEDWSGQITILNEMMGYYRIVGERKKGLQSVEDGLELIQSHGLADTVTAGTTWVNAATTMKAFGKTAEAMPYYEAASRIYHSRLDPSDYRLAGLYNNMALAFGELGRCRDALDAYERAMAIMKGLPGGEMELAVTMMNLACLYENWKSEDGAELSAEEREEKTGACLEQALAYLNDPQVERDGYYAFTCTKCADTFGHFGYFRVKKELEERAEQIYAGA